MGGLQKRNVDVEGNDVRQSFRIEGWFPKILTL